MLTALPSSFPLPIVITQHMPPLFTKQLADRLHTVMLTGMGADGCKETGLLRDAGGYVIAQDEESSVVWGMPGAVVHAGYSDDVVPLDDVARAIVDRVATTGSRPTTPRPAVSV